MNRVFKNIEYVDVIDSTNKELKNEKYNQYDNYVLIAKEQTEGRGRLTRTFVSNKDCGLYMSVRIKPTVEISKLNNLTCVVASIIVQALEKQIKDKIYIKWVNDLYLNGYKIAGILVESKINFNTNEYEYLIIGIGINLYNQEFDEELNKIASNIEKETNELIDKKLLIEDILNDLSNYIKDFNSKCYMKFYIERSFIINKFIKLQTITNTIDCKVVDINYDGELIIEHENQLKTVTSAEIIKTYI